MPSLTYIYAIFGKEFPKKTITFLSALAPKSFKNLSEYSPRFPLNMKLPLCKAQFLHILFFHKRLKTFEFIAPCIC